MQHAHYGDVVGVFGVEDGEGESAQSPETQWCGITLKRVSGGSGARMLGNMVQRSIYFIPETLGQGQICDIEVVNKGLLQVSGGLGR
ncbi:MAG: hypothetical protein BGO13_03195 [Burkholderiales bacterium 66-5]|nr:MAG: hypothetical protein BGO13_03195 [Burkholderiales bacterium 66-5]